MTSTKRPAFGQRVQITGKVDRSRYYHQRPLPGGRLGNWQTEVTWTERPAEAEGIFIGYRTVYEGWIEYVDDEVGNIFDPQGHLEVWLVVTDPRRNPIRCRPSQVKFDATPNN